MSNIHKNFNSRTREGATQNYVKGITREFVSIHAPVRVRQETGKVIASYPRVSIHAPVRVRRGCTWPGPDMYRFQFTHP